MDYMLIRLTEKITAGHPTVVGLSPKGSTLAEWRIDHEGASRAEVDAARAYLDSLDLAQERGTAQARSDLDDTDKEMPRALEDYIDLMIAKGVHTENELTEEIRAKRARKKALRSQLGR